MFKFFFYGLHCTSTSSNSLFTKLIHQKFSGFHKDTTEPLINGKLVISFSNKLKSLDKNLAKISSTTYKGDTQLVLIHQYLTTHTTISFSFAKNQLMKIELHYQQSFLFFILNWLLREQLQRQLFQQLIKLYIEQTLYWLVVNTKKVSCLHAAAIEKDGRVFILAGLNGVGKSTLAQQLIAHHNYHYFADNYLLLDNRYAYFAPDAVRLDRRSLQMIGIQSSQKFGFNKFLINHGHHSTLRKAPIAKVYWLSQANRWQKQPLAKQRFWQRVELLLPLHQEDVRLAPISQWLNKVIPLHVPSTSNTYYDLTIGQNQGFNLKHL